MRKAFLIAMTVVATMGLSACKIVYETAADQAVIPDGAEGDDARNAQRLDQTFESKFLPYVMENAVEIGELRRQVAADMEAAGTEHANRGAGQGAAWNFPVSGQGVVTEAKLDTRARSMALDTDADGTSDVTVQLGPVIRGTALRDAAPFFQFDDFRDQIEFAKLARALNNQLDSLITVPDGDIVGRTVSFVGVTPLKSATDKVVVTPVELQFQ